jgi:hypothetical protein
MLYSSRFRAAAAASSRRRAAPTCRGGASSLLRLAQPVAPRLPSTQEIGDWVQRAVNVLLPPRATAFAPSEFNPH